MPGWLGQSLPLTWRGGAERGDLLISMTPTLPQGLTIPLYYVCICIYILKQGKHRFIEMKSHSTEWKQAQASGSRADHPLLLSLWKMAISFQGPYRPIVTDPVSPGTPHFPISSPVVITTPGMSSGHPSLGCVLISLSLQTLLLQAPW